MRSKDPRQRLLAFLDRGDESRISEHLAKHPELASELEDVRRGLIGFRRHDGAGRAGDLDPEPPMPVRSPIEIPDLDLHEEIGRGAFGNVYRATDRITRRDVAVKIVTTATTPTSRKRFLREVEIIARLRTPNIVRLHRYGEHHGSLYYVMELLEGQTVGTLIEHWRRERPDDRVERAVEIVRIACSAFDAVHSLGVVHRDVKPSNLFVCRDGTVKLIDFGLAKALSDESMTGTGALLGTPAYMSPEQFEGDFRRIDRRTDVWALGATLYEALALRRPFDHGRESDAPRRRSRPANPRPLSGVSPDVPLSLSAIVQKAMEFEPQRRYATAGDMALDLSRFLEGESVSARPVGVLGGVLRRLSRHRLRIASLAALVIGVLSVAVVLVLVERRAERSRVVDATLETYRSSLASLTTTVARAHHLDREVATLRDELTPLAPYDERVVLLQGKRRLAELEERIRQLEDRTLIALQRGLEADPSDRGLRSALDEFVWQRYLDAERRGIEAPRRRFESLLRSYFPDRVDRITPRGALSITSDPPGGTAWLYRYELDGALLRPIPFHPRLGRLLSIDEIPAPRLRVVRRPGPALRRCGLRLGDVVTAVGGLPVGEAGNRAILRHSPGLADAAIEIDRDGARFELELPAFVYDDAASSSRGISVAAALNEVTESDVYSLPRIDGGSIGVTPLNSIEIPAGSYLLVVRRPGRVSARVPFVLSRDESIDLRVKLFTEAEIPSGFVHVPAGVCRLGGDSGAEYAEPEREVRLGDFFIQRYELNYSEYLQFLNDPEIRREITAHPGIDENFASSFLVPAEGRARKPRIRLNTDGEFSTETTEQANWGVRFISRNAADRFVAWRNERERKRGGRWRYALPTADEFEKAARGADARRYPWGNEFDWSLASTHRSSSSHSERQFKFPTDASPYDVRDLAGGLAEFTRTDELPPGTVPGDGSPRSLDCRIKGGSGFDDLERDFRLGGHRRERKKTASYAYGFRLVAYPIAEKEAETPARER